MSDFLLVEHLHEPPWQSTGLVTAEKLRRTMAWYWLNSYSESRCAPVYASIDDFIANSLPGDCLRGPAGYALKLGRTWMVAEVPR